jgi:hypothetical protein
LNLEKQRDGTAALKNAVQHYTPHIHKEFLRNERK